MTERTHGELLGFDIDPATGDVLAEFSDEEDEYAHRVRLKRSEIAGIAEASAEAFRVRTVVCERCHLDRPAFELNVYGICVVCVMGGR